MTVFLREYLMLLELLSRTRCIDCYIPGRGWWNIHPSRFHVTSVRPDASVASSWFLLQEFLEDFVSHKEPSLFLFPTFFTNLLPKTIQSSILTAALQEFRPVGYQTSILYSNEDTSLKLVHRVGYYTLEFSMLTSVE